MSDISSRVNAIIVDKLGVDENEVVPSASFTNDLGADSLDTVELIMEFERELLGLVLILIFLHPPHTHTHTHTHTPPFDIFCLLLLFFLTRNALECI